MDSAFCLATPTAVFGSPTLFLFPRSETQQKAAFSSCSSSSSSPSPSPFGSPCKHANADALFRIDDLLDFSNYDIGEGGGEHEDFYTSRNGMDLNSSNGDEKYHCMSPPQNELYAPCDELAEQLEWLSSVVEEESQQGWSFFIPTPTLQSTQKNGVEDDGIVVESFPQLEKAMPWRSRRSKRLRSYSSAWSVFQHSNREKSASCKKMKASPGCSEPHRRCSHCQVQKTPQWRGGPMGPKTLCNACGVRYKSGRLVTEYRPAGSPTFNIQVHSNSHKKILQMRSLKSQQAQPHTAAQLQSDYELQEPNDSKTSDTFHKDSSLETTIRQPSLS